MEKGEMYSRKGVLILSSILLVIWLLTGLPHLFSNVFKAINSWEVRSSYARKHKLSYLKEKTIRDLYPKRITASPNYRLRNVLEVTSTISIVTACKQTILVRGTKSQGLELIIIEGVPVYDSMVAIYKKKKTDGGNGSIGGRRKTNGLLDKNYIEVEGSHYLVLVSESLKEFKLSASQVTQELSAARENAESILLKIGQQNPDLLKQVAGLYLNNRRIILELKGYLDTEEKLVPWVNYLKTIRQRNAFV